MSNKSHEVPVKGISEIFYTQRIITGFPLVKIMAWREVKGKIQIRLRILQTKADVIYSRWDTMSITWHALPSTQQLVLL